jgi:hypothetical protein
MTTRYITAELSNERKGEKGRDDDDDDDDDDAGRGVNGLELCSRAHSLQKKAGLAGNNPKFPPKLCP